MSTSENFYILIRNIIQEELQKLDSTIPCVIESVNPDGTVNIYLLPDKNVVIPNIVNASKYELKRDDVVLLYKIQNKISNSFIIAKFNN